jgi:hypothetical protein
MTVNRFSWFGKQACKLVQVIGNFPAKFYIFSDQNFLWADMWPTNLGWSNLQSQKIAYLTHFLLMKPTRKQQYSLHYFSLHEAVSWFNYKSTSPQCRINHMAEAAYATGPALLGAPRFSLLLFCSLFQRGVQTVRQCGASKSPSPPENSRAQNIGPKCFLFVPCFSVSARGPKEPKVPRKRYRPPRFKNRGPKVRGPKRSFCSLF